MASCRLAAAGRAPDRRRRRSAAADAKSQRYEGLLQVFDAKGKITDKRWIRPARLHGDSKAVLRFTAPAEVKGVALLVVNHPDRASDQWMWTPAIERDRRIALQDRSTRFFGTDFSFEDLEERDVNQYDYTLIGDETVDGAACWRIEAAPARRQGLAVHALDRLDPQGQLRLRADRELHQGPGGAPPAPVATSQNVQGIWTARQLEMTDLRRGSRTVLTLDKLEYNVPMKDDDFTLQALRREQ